MTFVTRLTLRSGDRAVLDATVKEIKTFVSRKGAELKGPHPRPPSTIYVGLSKRLRADDDQFSRWKYTVYRREMEIRGYDTVAREATTRAYPSSVHVAVEVEQLGHAR